MTQIQKNIDTAVCLLVEHGWDAKTAREMILAQRAAAYTPPPVFKNAPRLVVVR